MTYGGIICIFVHLRAEFQKGLWNFGSTCFKHTKFHASEYWPQAVTRNKP